MIVRYLLDVAIYCVQSFFFILLFLLFITLAVPWREGQAAFPLTSACLLPAYKHTLPQSKEPQGFELQPQLKDNTVAL